MIQGVVNTFVIFISRIIAQIAAGFSRAATAMKGEGSSTVIRYLFRRCDGAGTGLRGILAKPSPYWFSVTVSFVMRDRRSAGSAVKNDCRAAAPENQLRAQKRPA